MGDQLTIISDNTKSLQDSGEALQAELSSIKDRLNAITCTPPVVCPDTSGLVLEANFTNVPNITNELDSVLDIVNNDFAGNAEKVGAIRNTYTAFL